MVIRKGWTTLTFQLPQVLRDMLMDYADAQHTDMSECMRRILAEKFTQLQQGQETP